MMSLEVPILFLIFNRPETTRQVFSAIRSAQPARLYVAADGPRRDRPDEALRCEQVRAIATVVDWPCEVKTLFRNENLGCRRALSEGISWFFENEPEGIILEDDCLPNKSFFMFCAELLQRYRDDERIMCITGNNFQPQAASYPYDYYFSTFNHCWGWASWRRAWKLYDIDMSMLDEFVDTRILGSLSNEAGFEEYWRSRFDEVAQRKIDTWDYVWTFSCWSNSGLTCTPRCNLVSNIGFGADATHTTSANSAQSKLPVGELRFPLSHPRSVMRNRRLDDVIAADHYRLGRKRLPLHLRILHYARRKLALRKLLAQKGRFQY